MLFDDYNPIEKYWAWLKKKMRKMNLENDNFFKNLDYVFLSEYRTIDF